jgi:hypothetical protein
VRRSVLSNMEPTSPELGIKPIDNPGFSLPFDYILRTYSWLDRWGILPDPGGLNDQDALWIADIELYSGMKSQEMRAYMVMKSDAAG